MKHLLLIYLLLFVKQYRSQNLAWAKQFAGTSSQTYPEAVTTDQNGNVFTTGFFVGFVDFDPGAGNAYLSSTFPTFNNPQYTDIFVSKLNLTGSYQWAWNFRKVGGVGSGGGKSICTDAFGNSYITGYFSGSVNFEPTFTTNYVLTSYGNTDIFILKLDPMGNFVWAVQMGGTSSETGLSIAVDPIGNIYTTGNFSGTSDFDPGAGTYTLNSNGGADIFISKLDPSGNFLWAKSMGGISNDQGASIAIDPSLNISVAGVFYGTVDFDPGPLSYTLSSVVGTTDGFMMKVDNNGNFLWVKQIAGSALDNVNAMALDPTGNIYLTGAFSGVTDFDPGPLTFSLNTYGSSDIFVSKYDPFGNFVWTSRMGGPSGEEAYGITIGPSGDIFTTGAFFTICDFDPGSGSYTLSPTSLSQDIFLSRLNTGGNFVSAKRIGGTGTEWGKNITTDILGDIVFTGHFAYGTGIDFDPGPATYTMASISDDGFVTKFSDCTSPTSITVSTSNSNICAGQSLTMTTSGASTYTLFPGATTGSLQVITPTISTIYTVIGTNTSNCKDLKSFSVTVNLTPTVTIVSSNSVLCSGQTTTLTANGANTYTWNTSTTSSSISVTPSITTIYSVTGISSFGCSSICTYTQSVSACTDLSELTKINTIKISPNPNAGNFTIEFKNESEKSIEIVNILGQSVKTVTTSDQSVRFDINNLPSGTYYAIIKMNNNVTTTKLIKQ